MSTCNESHPEHPERRCSLPDSLPHGDHLDYAHKHEPWPNQPVLQQAALRREQSVGKRGRNRSGMKEIAAAIAGSKMGTGEVVLETKAEGMDRALSATPEEFKASFYECLHEVALTHDTFTSDHVRMVLERRGVEVENPNSIGPLMPQGAKRGWMTKTDERAVSERGLGKGRDGLSVWKSLIR